MRWWLLAGGVLVLSLLAMAPGTSADEYLVHGPACIGVATDGSLGIDGVAACPSTWSKLGLTHIPLREEGPAAHSREGWGVAWTRGATDTMSCGGGTCDAPAPTCSQTGPPVIASRCNRSGIEVVHTFQRAPQSGVFEGKVTITNHGSAVSDILYRRTGMWEMVNVAADREYITTDGPGPPPDIPTFSMRLSAVDPATPMAPNDVVCGPTSMRHVDCGVVVEPGYTFDAVGPALPSGGVWELRFLFGTTGDSRDLKSAAVAHGMSLWSIAEPEANPATGGPVSFLYALVGTVPDPEADFSVPSPCTLQEFTLRDRSTIPGHVTVYGQTWSSPGQPDQTGPTATYNFTTAGRVPITLTIDTSAGTFSVTRSVYVDPCLEPPVAAFTCWDEPPDWLRVRFEDRSTAGRRHLVAWDWAFGDGATGDDRHPTRLYAAKGWYNVTLDVTNNIGKTASVTQPCYADLNLPPDLLPMRRQLVYEGETVDVPVVATDPDGDDLSWRMDRSQVPAASFGLGDPPATLAAGTTASIEGGRFVWRTHAGDAGTYEVLFQVRDTWHRDIEVLVIEVRPGIDLPGPESGDADGDGAPDAHDACPADVVCGPVEAIHKDGQDGEGDPDDGDPDDGDEGADKVPDAVVFADTDRDGATDDTDNCVRTPNRDQADLDGDGRGDACDPDRDDDRVPEAAGAGPFDNCPWSPNPLQTDSDGDGVGDDCQGDVDRDGVPDDADNCPVWPNPLQADVDRQREGCVSIEASLDERAIAPAPGNTRPPAAWLGGGLLLGLVAALVVLLVRRRA